MKLRYHFLKEIFLVLVLGCSFCYMSCSKNSQRKPTLASNGNKYQWTVDLEAPRPSLSLLYDVNADGNIDVVTAADSGKIQAFNGSNGEILWSTPYSQVTCASSPVAWLYSTSGIPDIVYATESQLLILSGSDGNLLASYDIQGGMGVEPLICQSDDSSAFIVWGNRNSAMVFDAGNSSPMWYLDSYGISPYGHPSEFHLNDSLYILFTCFRNDSVFTSALNLETGILLWESYLSPYCFTTTPGVKLVDFDGDGTEEIVSCFGLGTVTLHNSANGDVIWRNSYNMTEIYADPVVADLDKDNSYEILVSLYDACCICILDESGEEERRISLRGQPLRAPTLFDLNGDGYCEIILSCGIINGDIQIFDGFSFEELAYIGHSYSIPSGVEVTDLNRDGVPEFLYSSGDGRLYVLPVSSVL